ncbi:MAG: hypothetical protein SGI71_13810 [Verrucomicrobiota bacterium]|nr:hypothetical protein [Verrucomicrobiota bacterium]
MKNWIFILVVWVTFSNAQGQLVVTDTHKLNTPQSIAFVTTTNGPVIFQSFLYESSSIGPTQAGNVHIVLDGTITNSINVGVVDVFQISTAFDQVAQGNHTITVFWEVVQNDIDRVTSAATVTAPNEPVVPAGMQAALDNLLAQLLAQSTSQNQAMNTALTGQLDALSNTLGDAIANLQSQLGKLNPQDNSEIIRKLDQLLAAQVETDKLVKTRKSKKLSATDIGMGVGTAIGSALLSGVLQSGGSGVGPISSPFGEGAITGGVNRPGFDEIN